MIWSLALATIGIAGLYLAGKKNYWGWGIGLAAQVLWIIYAIVTDQYGFIISALAYGFVYGKNFIDWGPSIKLGREVITPREVGDTYSVMVATGGRLSKEAMEEIANNMRTRR